MGKNKNKNTVSFLINDKPVEKPYQCNACKDPQGAFIRSLYGSHGGAERHAVRVGHAKTNPVIHVCPQEWCASVVNPQKKCDHKHLWLMVLPLTEAVHDDGAGSEMSRKAKNKKMREMNSVVTRGYYTDADDNADYW